MNTLIEHLERHLGPIQGGYDLFEEAPALFQVVRFARGPHVGVNTLSTLGVSNFNLVSGDRHIRQELVMFYKEMTGERNLPGVLKQVAVEHLACGRGLRRGDVIGPRGTLLDGWPFVALYVAMPVYMPDDFMVFHPSTGSPVVVAWLVPISNTEVEFVREKGWSAFEDELERVDPDLTDWDRPLIS